VTRPPSVFDQLFALIVDRKARRPEHSYTTRLLDGGTAKIGEKVLEEAGEVVEAAAESGEDGRQHLIHEAADLVYHLWVMLALRDVTLDDVQAELARREGVSGLDEKAARNPSPPDTSAHE